MIEKNLMNELIVKSVGSHIQKDMEMVSRTFYSVVEKYAFLFEGDMLLAQRMLVEACFPSSLPVMVRADSSIEDSEEKVHFNMNQIIGSIPEKMKQELYQRLMAQFVTKIEIDDINGKKGDAE